MSAPRADWSVFTALDDTSATEFTTTLTERQSQLLLFALFFLEGLEWENADNDEIDGTIHRTMNNVIP